MDNWEQAIKALVLADRDYCVDEEEEVALDFAIIETVQILSVAGFLADGTTNPAVAVEMVWVLQELFLAEPTLESQFGAHLCDAGYIKLVSALESTLLVAHPTDPGEIEERELFAETFEEKLKSLLR